MSLTITEALAEIKTIGKRLEKKHEFLVANLGRREGAKDPLEKDGGSVEVLKRERQAIADLENRVVALRAGIQRANTETIVALHGVSRSISDWLTWRRDVAPKHKALLSALQGTVQQIRQQARNAGHALVPPGGTPAAPTDIVLNIDEGELAREIEQLEDILGQLDGQLSLKNATVLIQEG